MISSGCGPRARKARTSSAKAQLPGPRSSMPDSPKPRLMISARRSRLGSSCRANSSGISMVICIGMNLAHPRGQGQILPGGVQAPEHAGIPDRKVAGLTWLRNQIVISVPDDLGVREFPGGKMPAHIHATINVRRIGFPASHQIAALELRGLLVFAANQAVFPGTDPRGFEVPGAGLFFDQHLDRSAHERFRNSHGYLM